jgi:hypothetical protein
VSLWRVTHYATSRRTIGWCRSGTYVFLPGVFVWRFKFCSRPCSLSSQTNNSVWCYFIIDGFVFQQSGFYIIHTHTHTHTYLHKHMHFILEFSVLFWGWILSNLITPLTVIEQPVVEEVDRFFGECLIFSPHYYSSSVRHYSLVCHPVTRRGLLAHTLPRRQSGCTPKLKLIFCWRTFIFYPKWGRRLKVVRINATDIYSAGDFFKFQLRHRLCWFLFVVFFSSSKPLLDS